MGQRLNVEIHGCGVLLANAYYHWSAYSGEALKITKEILDLLDDDSFVRQYPDNRELAIRLLEKTGAGANEGEQEAIQNDPALSKYTVQDCKNRNEGLLSITREGMAETRSWEEGRVEIDIVSGTFRFQVYCYMSKKQYLEYEDENSYNELPIFEEDMCDSWDFDEFDKVLEIYNKSKSQYGYRLPNGNVICWVE